METVCFLWSRNLMFKQCILHVNFWCSVRAVPEEGIFPTFLGPTPTLIQWTTALSPGDKVAGAWNWPRTSIKCRGEKCVELYLHPTYTFLHRSWLRKCLGRNWITRWRSWLRHCATSRKIAGSIPDGIIGIYYWHNPSGRTMALGLTQPLTQMSIRNISWG